MRIVSIGDNLQWTGKSCFPEKKETYQFVVCWISPESGKAYDKEWGNWNKIYHYENTPIQIYRKFLFQKLKIFS